MGVLEIGLERIFDDCLVTCHGFLQMKNGLWNEDKRFFNTLPVWTCRSVAPYQLPDQFSWYLIDTSKRVCG